MKIEKVKALIQEALPKFVSLTGYEIATDIHVLNADQIATIREEIIQQLDAVREEYTPGTLGETVAGDRGIAIIFYSFEIKDVTEFYHTFYHECVHALFKSKNFELTAKQMKGKSPRRILLGYSLVDEFLAEAYANFAASRSFYPNQSTAQNELKKLLYLSVPNARIDTRAFIPSSLGLYCAAMLTDPYIIELMEENPCFDRGFGIYNATVVNAVEDIIEFVVRFLCDGFEFVVSEKDLEHIGKLLIIIQNNC